MEDKGKKNEEWFVGKESVDRERAAIDRLFDKCEELEWAVDDDGDPYNMIGVAL